MNPQPLVLETSALPIELRPFVRPPTYRIRVGARCAPCDCGPLKANEVRVYVFLGRASNRKCLGGTVRRKIVPAVASRRWRSGLVFRGLTGVVQYVKPPCRVGFRSGTMGP